MGLEAGTGDHASRPLRAPASAPAIAELDANSRVVSTGAVVMRQRRRPPRGRPAAVPGIFLQQAGVVGDSPVPCRTAPARHSRHGHRMVKYGSAAASVRDREFRRRGTESPSAPHFAVPKEGCASGCSRLRSLVVEGCATPWVESAPGITCAGGGVSEREQGREWSARARGRRAQEPSRQCRSAFQGDAAEVSRPSVPSARRPDPQGNPPRDGIRARSPSGCLGDFDGEAGGSRRLACSVARGD